MIVEKCRPSELAESIRNGMHQHSLFSCPAFAALWKTHGGTATCWICQEKGNITSVLSGVEFRGKLLTRFQAMPDGLYARIYHTTDDPHRGSESAQALGAAIASAGYARLFLSDYFGEFDGVRGCQAVTSHTVLVDVSSPGWEPPDATIRSEIRKAEREGGRVVRFDSRRHMAGFLRLMRATEERHGRLPKYSDEFYAALGELAAGDSRVHWLVAEHETELAASHIYLVDGDLALYWQSFFDKKYSFLKPNQHMLYRTAVQLASRGVKTLNLGASPEDAEGLRHYKESWGGTAKSYPLYIRKSWIGKLL